MGKLQFHVPGIPSPGGSKTAFPVKDKNGYVFKDGRPVTNMVDSGGKKTKVWRKAVATRAHMAMKIADMNAIDCPISVIFEFYMPRPKYHFKKNGSLKDEYLLNDYHTKTPDALKLARSTEDAMKGIVYKDDSLIWKETIYKKYHIISGCHITIEW